MKTVNLTCVGCGVSFTVSYAERFRIYHDKICAAKSTAKARKGVAQPHKGHQAKAGINSHRVPKKYRCAADASNAGQIIDHRTPRR